MSHNSIRGWRKLRAELLAAQPDCACGAPAAELGHIIPRAYGGIDALPNVVGQCSHCNRELLYADRRAGGSVIAGLIRRPDEIKQADTERWADLADYARAVGLDVLQGRAPAPRGRPEGHHRGHQEGLPGAPRPERQKGRADSPARATEEWSPAAAVIRSRPR
jgi:hypothetical protein